MLTIMKFPKPGEAARPDEQIVCLAHVSFGEMNIQNNKGMMTALAMVTITSEKKTENRKQIIKITIMIT